jgi:hypothetical protein
MPKKELEKSILEWFKNKQKDNAIKVLKNLQALRHQIANETTQGLEILARLTLIKKAKEYAIGGDRLYNFKPTYLFDKEDSKEVCIGYAIKHAKSVMDILKGKLQADVYTVEEKFGDLYNYCLLFIAICKEQEE